VAKMKTIADMREANNKFLERNVRKIVMSAKVGDVMVVDVEKSSQVNKINPTMEKLRELRDQDAVVKTNVEVEETSS